MVKGELFLLGKSGLKRSRKKSPPHRGAKKKEKANLTLATPSVRRAENLLLTALNMISSLSRLSSSLPSLRWANEADKYY